MSDVENKRVTLVDEDNPWSRACIESFAKDGINLTLHDPTKNFPQDTIEGGVFIVPVSSGDSKRFTLIKQIAESGGFSLILAGGAIEHVALKCMTLNNVVYVGQKSLEFGRVKAVAREIPT